MKLKIQTSNKFKQDEFDRILKDYTIEYINIDLKEPISEPNIVAAYKATQAGEGILIEDTIFEVEGFDFGVAVKFKKEKLLTLAEEVGHDIPAYMETRLAIMQENKIYIYIGRLKGVVTQPYREHPQMIRRVFKHEDSPSPREIACDKFLNYMADYIVDPIYSWAGEFQH